MTVPVPRQKRRLGSSVPPTSPLAMSLRFKMTTERQAPR